MLRIMHVCSVAAFIALAATITFALVTPSSGSTTESSTTQTPEPENPALTAVHDSTAI